MKDFPVSLIQTVTARNKNSKTDFFLYYFFLTTLLSLKMIKMFLHEVCPEACVASILGVFWDPAGLKPWTAWSDLRVDPALTGKLGLEMSWCPFQAQLPYDCVKLS